ncbi:MAG: UDP-2,3-diacylglucosamine diphosphatase [Runella sp.]
MPDSTLHITLSAHKKIYFASDFHLGAPDHNASLIRERRLLQWLDTIRQDAQMICLVGDLFDFWFEYRRVVPKGFVRLLGKLGELSDAGIEILVFPGNHDMWVSGYFEKELGIKCYRKPLQLTVESYHQTTWFWITHGDGLGPGDEEYKRLKKVFENRAARWLFGNLFHPDWALWLGHTWAKYSWQKHQKEGLPTFMGEQNEWLFQYAKDIEQRLHHDFYVFGHRHIELYHPLSERSQVIILGDWIHYSTYGVFDGQAFVLTRFEK